MGRRRKDQGGGKREEREKPTTYSTSGFRGIEYVTASEQGRGRMGKKGCMRRGGGGGGVVFWLV